MDTKVGEHVLIVGCGYVGQVAARLLVATGRRVTGLRRGEVGEAHGVTMLQCDVLDRDQQEAIPRDADVIVIALSPGGGGAERYRAAYLTAPEVVVARQHVLPRLVVMTTSTAVYGQDDGSWVDEDSPALPASATGQVLVEAETALARLGMPSSSLRLGGIYGPGRDRLVHQVAAGEASCVAGHWTNRIHRDDAADAVAHLICADTAVPEVCNVVDDTPALHCEVLGWLAARLNAPEPTVLPAGSGTGRKATSKRVSNARLRSTGWRPGHPSWRDGYEALLDAR